MYFYDITTIAGPYSHVSWIRRVFSALKQNSGELARVATGNGVMPSRAKVCRGLHAGTPTQEGKHDEGKDNGDSIDIEYNRLNST